MEIKAELKFARVAPRKLRPLAKAAAKMRIDEALNFLHFSNKKGALIIKKVLESAISNARNNFKLNRDDLIIKKIEIGEGSAYKRWRAVSRGMAHGYKKRTSHIKVFLTKIKEIPVEGEKKNGSKS